MTGYNLFLISSAVWNYYMYTVIDTVWVQTFMKKSSNGFFKIDVVSSTQ